MRTTVTLDPDVEALLKRVMRERGLSFKEALNDAVRRGLGGRTRRPFRTAAFSMGPPAVPLTKALALAGELEDEVAASRLSVRK